MQTDQNTRAAQAAQMIIEMDFLRVEIDLLKQLNKYMEKVAKLQKQINELRQSAALIAAAQ